ncbi:putative potassium channel [Arachis hypogaea]|nr:putative potassium channel [Arachis hypogaea]
MAMFSSGGAFSSFVKIFSRSRDTIQAVTNFAKQNTLPILMQEQMIAHFHMKYRTDIEGLQQQEIMFTFGKARVPIIKFLEKKSGLAFDVRKHYCNLLYHYEQVHFFNVKGPLYSPSSDSVSGSKHSWRSELAIVEYSPKPVNHTNKNILNILKVKIDGDNW